MSGETVQGPRPSDLFDAFVDADGDVVVVLFDVRGLAESSSTLLDSMMSQTRAALEAHEPLHQVVNELEMQLAVRPGAEVGLVILRLSQRDARVEILNAGMPPVANTLPGGRLDLHAPMSGPIGRRIGEVHPYELVPLIWGSAWCALSDGMTGGSLEPSLVADLCVKLDLQNQGMKLAASNADALYDALQGLLPLSRFLRDDATALFVGADAHGHGGRFQSGIEPASH